MLSFAEDVRLYDKEKQITVVDIRPGLITGTSAVNAMVDELTVEESMVTVSVDLSDLQYYTEEKTGSVTPVLALYENGRLRGIQMQEQVELNNGIAEMSLAVESSDEITECRVFILESVSTAGPLCPAIKEIWGVLECT